MIELKDHSFAAARDQRPAWISRQRVRVRVGLGLGLGLGLVRRFVPRHKALKLKLFQAELK